ncbi:MAG: hypothetical protein R2834_06195 [Rhodothermales bacterium]
MSSVQEELLIAEYNALRAENLQRIDHLAAQTWHILFITGAMWAWLLSQENAVITIAYWIPLVITVLLWFNNLMTIRTIRRVSGYLKKVTDTVQLPGELGWEAYLKQHPLGHMSTWTTLFWVALIVVNALLPVYLLFIR